MKKYPSFLTSPLNRRLTFRVVLFSAMLSIVLTLYQLYRDYLSDLEGVRQGHENIISSYREPLTYDVWIMSRPLIESQLLGIKRLPGISYVMLESVGWEKWSYGSPREDHRHETRVTLEHTNGRGAKVAIGTLIIQSDIRQIYNRAMNRALMTFLANGFQTIVVAGFIMLVVHRSIGRPLREMIVFFNSFSLGKDMPSLVLNRKSSRDPDEVDQAVLAINKMVMELTESYRAVKRSESKLSSIYRMFPVIVWSLDKDGIFTMSEGKDLASLGLKPGERVGDSIFEVHRGNRSILDSIRLGYAGQYNETEMHVGDIVYQASVMPIINEDGDVEGVYGLAINVSDKKKAESEIANLRNYLSSIINSMPSVLIGVDRDGHISQWNRQAEVVSQVKEEDAMGKHFTQVFPALADLRDHVDEAVKTGAVYQRPRVARAAGLQKYFEDVTIYPLQNSQDQGAVIRIDDVSDMVRIEEMMIQNEKMLSVGGLAAGMAHEINNPLAGMIQTASVLQSRLDNIDMAANQKAAREVGVSMEAIQAYMEKRGIIRMAKTINQSGMKMGELVENMLSFARKADTDDTTSHQPEYLVDQILELAATEYDLKKHYDFKSIRIVKEYQDDLPMVICEGGKIQQVLLNILRNGAQAMHEHPESTGGEPQFIIRLTTEEKNRYLRIEIEDNGPGMDRKVQKRIFEPFFTTKPVGMGTGLGLSVSYFIITENHQGTMNVVSEPGKGAVFIIRLPLTGMTT